MDDLDHFDYLDNNNFKEKVTFEYNDNMSYDEILELEQKEKQYYLDNDVYSKPDMKLLSKEVFKLANESNTLQLESNTEINLVLYNDKIQQGTSLSVYLTENGVRKNIANHQVTFNVNNNIYYRTTNQYGVVSLNINLEVLGNHDVYITFSGYSQAKFKINVYRKEVNLTSLSYTLHKGEKYQVKITDNGVPVTNRNVTFVINGVPYTRTSNGSGIASLNINLNPGNYVMTYYLLAQKGYFSTSQFTKDLTVRPNTNLIPTKLEQLRYFTKKTTGFNLMVKLYNANSGSILANKAINFDFRGTRWNTITNSNGIAEISINSFFSLGTYTAGATYDGDSQYKSTSIYVSFHVADSDTVITSSDSTSDLNKYKIGKNEWCNYTNSYMVNLANSITTSSSNDFEKILASYYYAASIVHDPSYGNIKNKDYISCINNYANCVDHSSVLISLLRSFGVPSRYVLALNKTNTSSGHAWVQICLNGLWVTADSDGESIFGVLSTKNVFTIDKKYRIIVNQTEFPLRNYWGVLN